MSDSDVGKNREYTEVRSISKETETRKLEHIEICLNKNVQFKRKTAGFEEIELVHQSIPELNLKEIDTTLKFLGEEFSYPILINAMTGGHALSTKINRTLAQIAAEFNIPMGVGSQRAALEDNTLVGTYRIAREAAQFVSGKIFLIGNIGAAQLIKTESPNHATQLVKECIEMIEADAIAIHLNPLQEALQKEGDVDYKGLINKLGRIIKTVKVPVIIKETGNGLSPQVLKALKAVGVKYVDVSGAGGTSWAAIESFRHEENSVPALVANDFRDWGIPTAVSTILAAKMGFNVIASGGIRSGIDIAKALACGAEMAGLALPFLKSAYMENVDILRAQLLLFSKELKTSMFLTGSANLASLKLAKKIFFGRIKDWLTQLEPR
ncbi:MAG: type 2 isopentenyl-diphosphate Delta-isomerase [Candidatus Helarchaeota archaeon]